MADIQSGAVNSSLGKSAWALVSVFTISIFLSAALLFSVQPMFAKLALPLLGGAPNVWNTAMVFFQGTLLGGYLYAHLLSKHFELRMQVLIHALVSCAGLFFIPLTIASGWEPPTGGAQAFWLIGLFAVSVGVPFFAISANSPLLQRWFSRTNDKDADDPYFLYAASNAGSLLSLCLYPILFEPMLRLQEQTGLWAMGYMAMTAAILIAGGFAYRNLKNVETVDVSAVKPASKISATQRLYWIFLAFIPSSLMLGVTTYMTTDIASAPFLWIMPLALFLLTFIIVFAKNPIVNFAQLSKLFPWVIAVVIVAAVSLKPVPLASIAIALLGYFIIALLCHSRLAETRPNAASLTEFYIWMSLGGVLGGIFNALIAPLIFNGAYEYFLILFMAGFVVLEPGETSGDKFRQVGKFLVVAITSFTVFAALMHFGVSIQLGFIFASFIFFVAMRFVRYQKKHMIAEGILVAVMIVFLPSGIHNMLMKDRSFFGVLRVESFEFDDGRVHMFSHGTTLHNLQLMDPDKQIIPLSYYSKGNTFHQALSAARQNKPNVNVAVIGLGAGAMACHEQFGDKWTYFEIDPAVVKMARNPDYFTYMQNCSIEDDVRIGDARLKIMDLAPKSQDLIMVDAFSSNVIPAHLVTKEAMEAYRSRLKDDGLIFFHTSNRLLDVTSVVVTLAENMELASRHIAYRVPEGVELKTYISPSDAVLVGTPEAIKKAALGEGWAHYIPSPDVGLWTDDYSHILGTLIPIQKTKGYRDESGSKNALP